MAVAIDAIDSKTRQPSHTECHAFLRDVRQAIFDVAITHRVYFSDFVEQLKQCNGEARHGDLLVSFVMAEREV